MAMSFPRGLDNLPRQLKELESDVEALGKALTKAFEEGSKSSTGLLDKMASFNGAVDTVRVFGSNLSAVPKAAFSAAEALGSMAVAAMNSAATLQTQADNLGITTTSLQEMHFIGQKVGMSVADMDGALATFSQNAASAAVGQGDLAKIAAEYNLQLTDSNGNLKSSGELLTGFADVVKAAGSEQEQARIVTAAFGKDAIGLVDVFKQGSNGLQSYGDRAKELGAIIDSDLIAKSSELSNQVESLKAGLFNTFNSGLLEGLTQSSGEIEASLERMRPAAEMFGKVLGASLMFIVDVIDTTIRGLNKLGGFLGKTLGIWFNAQDELASLKSIDVGDLSERQKARIQELQAQIKAEADIRAEADRKAEERARQHQQNLAAIEAAAKAATSRSSQTQVSKPRSFPTDDVLTSLKDLGKETDAFLKQQSEAEGASQDLAALLAKNWERAGSEISAAAQAAKSAAEDTRDAAVTMGNLLANVGESLKDTLADSLQAALDGKIKSIGELVKNVGGTVSSKLKGFVGGKATEALTGMLGSFGVFAGPLGGMIGSAAGALAGKAINAFGKLLGGKPSDKIEATTFDLTSGYRLENDLGRGKDSPENRALANEIESQVRRINDALTKAGLTSSAHGFMIEAGSGHSLAPFRGSVNGGAIQSFQTKDQMLAFLTGQIVGGLQEVPEKLQAYINGIDYTNVEKFVAEIGKIASFNQGMADVRDQILQITDPKTWNLRQIDEKFAGLLEQANLFGTQADIDAINQLKNLQKSQVRDPLKDFMEPFTDELAELLDPDQYRLDKIAEEFARLREEANKLGASVEDLNALEQLEQARIEAPLREGMHTIRGEMKDLDDAQKDPQQRELDDLRDRYSEMLELAEGHAEELTEIDEWYGRRRKEITERYAQEAAQIAAEEASNLLEEIAQQARDNINQQLDILSQQGQEYEESIGQFKGLLDSIKSARSRIMNDPRTSPVSNEQRLTDLMAQLHAAAAKAQTGDMEAAAEVADLATAAAEANVAFNASSEEGARIQGEIARILDSTGSVANRQLQVAELSLAANEAQVTLLQAQLESVNKTVAPARRAAERSDFTRISNAFEIAKTNALAGGMTDQQFVNSPVYAGIKNDLFGMISTTTDEGFLREDLINARSHGAGTDAYAAASAERVSRILDRMAELGIDPDRPPSAPSAANGGRVGAFAYVHPNEMIYTGPPAMVYNARETASMMTGGNVLRELQGIRADIGVLSRTVSITGEDQVVQLSRHDMRLAAIESNFTLARARA